MGVFLLIDFVGIIPVGQKFISVFIL
jgi:hypothetical protein